MTERDFRGEKDANLRIIRPTPRFGRAVVSPEWVDELLDEIDRLRKEASQPKEGDGR